MTSLLCSFTSSLSSKSTLSINGDNEEEYDFQENISEYKLEIFPRNRNYNDEDRDDISFRDDAKHNEIVTILLENKKEGKAKNKKKLIIGSAPKIQIKIPQIQLNLKPKSKLPTSLEIISSEVTVPVLVISAVEEESKDKINNEDILDDGNDQFVDAKEWGS
ncbi:8991_t:CDS:2 [Dentiscutata erythropus]|uniref:8991_t:CDS:1 n=1 Tax=Dentiscutata erythropus TaxID=1348616 RepID=A0A9N9JRZ9_9GLOM|nr:8991_t:CDS:2 [Dentiscutata erythropus]